MLWALPQASRRSKDIPTARANVGQRAEPDSREVCRLFGRAEACPEPHRRGNAIHQDEAVQPDDLMREVQGRSAEVSDFNLLVEGTHRFEKPNHIRPHAVVPKQDVPDAANERFLHRIFATPIFRPDGSNA